MRGRLLRDGPGRCGICTAAAPATINPTSTSASTGISAVALALAGGLVRVGGLVLTEDVGDHTGPAAQG
ncbi:hypothetical protein, partial [Microtetraspora malaysiensis]|uniref:hypothetical protein n=1 Tax=Microtetraspora malaysiensis TaxID=161358 RepID=UPI001471F196